MDLYGFGLAAAREFVLISDSVLPGVDKDGVVL